MFSLAIVLTVLMLLVLYFDITSYIIPNWLVGLVLVFYVSLLLFSPVPVDWKAGGMAFLVAFFLGFLMFSAKLMGGGDVKLLAACCLWTGFQALPEYLIYTSLLGGVLAFGLLLGRPVIGYYAARYRKSETPLPRVFLHGEPVPYGVAIAGAFLAVLWMGKLPGIGKITLG
jgi:prepilin peptidase CpaA